MRSGETPVVLAVVEEVVLDVVVRPIDRVLTMLGTRESCAVRDLWWFVVYF